MKKLKFCEYIQGIKPDFVRGDTYLFIRLDMKSIGLIKNIQGKKIIALEINQNRWEEVEWDINDTDKIYSINAWDIIKSITNQK